jgi:hypothetical protein
MFRCIMSAILREPSVILMKLKSSSSSSSVALQPGVGLGLHYNTTPSLSIPRSISPFVYSHLSQVRRHLVFGLPLRLVAYRFP